MRTICVLLAVGFLISCTKPGKPVATAPTSPPLSITTMELAGTKWLLEDLNGAGVVDRVQATLEFLPQGKLSGSASCNRLMSSYETKSNAIKIGPTALTRKMCSPAVQDQETKFTAALEAVNRYEVNANGHLLLYGAEGNRSLRFSPLTGER